MAIQIILIILGFILLIKGADFLVKGGSNIATRFHIPEIVIGLTIVSIGTSMPELFISVTSAINGHSDMAIGNVIGSNLANILLILGVCALIKNLKIKKETRYFEAPFTFLITILVFVLANNNLNGQINTITRFEGCILILICIMFIIYNIIMAKKGEEFDDTIDGISKDLAIIDIKTQSTKYLVKSIFYVVLGILFLKFGGDFVVDNVSKFAESLGISEKIISITIISIATSLPELITSVVATTKNKADMAIGNIIGSCILNLILIIGVSAIINPISYFTGFNLDFGILILVTLIMCLIPYIGKKNEIEKWQGALFLFIYVLYICFAIWK